MENHTALLLVDVQKGFFDPEHFSLYKSETVLKNMVTLLNRAHSEGAMVIFMQHTDADLGFEKGSDNWQIHPLLEPSDQDYVIEKTTPSSFLRTRLNDLLIREEIKYLVIAGVNTESSIDTTCRQSFANGFHNILVKDAHSTFDTIPLTAEQIIEHHHRIMANWFAELIETKDIEFF